MDRFIVAFYVACVFSHCYLKSNMDRFIETQNVAKMLIKSVFKIQYG